MENSKQLVLVVAEALARDVGRTVARFDPGDLAYHGLATGDVVEIKGYKETVVRVMPAPPEHREQGKILIDGIIRENAKIGLGDKVVVSKVRCRPAKVVSLELNSGQSLAVSGTYLQKYLEGLVLVIGDKARVSLFGTRRLEARVIGTQPEGPVQVVADTQVKLGTKAGQPEEHRIAYEDIGGLESELRQVREIVELPLKYPEVFGRLGIDPPKGILLSGPPGTGKTLIARAVAKETNASFFHVNGPEIINKYYGESEAKLREIFEAAYRKAPSIIFLDEVDAIAPKREEVHGEVEKRVVAQLLGLMDGLQSRGQVIIIAATNIPNSLDPALRRPGRFDREILVGVPDQTARLKILQIHTRGMPLAGDVNLEQLAQMTHGYVGADLEALCKEAAMGCLRQVVPVLGANPLSDDSLLQLRVSMNDFLGAWKGIEPSVTREVYVEIPNVGWDQVGGLAEIKEKLAEAVEWPLKYPELFAQAKLAPVKGILLYGPPGTGKTLVAKAIATTSAANFISVKGPALMSRWVGESEKGIRDIFKKARLATPCIIFFDELDAIVPLRGSDHPATERVLSQLLTEMDGIEEMHGVLVMGATNRIDMIDPALLRPGRFDLHLEFPIPDSEARSQILNIHCAHKPLHIDTDMQQLVEATEGFSGAQIAHLSRKATLLAIKELVHTADPSPEKLVVRQGHFRQALDELNGERR